MGQRLPLKDKDDFPGAGSYEPGARVSYRHEPSYTMRKKMKIIDHQKSYSMPGPGAYQPAVPKK